MEVGQVRHRIDWTWLKSTEPGASGCIPRLGLEYQHRAATPMHCEQILVHDGDSCHRILRDGGLKSGWTAPHQVAGSAWR